MQSFTEDPNLRTGRTNHILLVFQCSKAVSFSFTFQFLLQSQKTHLALLVTDSQVLPAAMRGRQDTHRHPPQHVSADQLPDRLALVPAVVHTDVLKSAFLRAKSWDLSH